MLFGGSSFLSSALQIAYSAHLATARSIKSSLCPLERFSETLERIPLPLVIPFNIFFRISFSPAAISWDEQQMSRVVSLTTAAAQGSAKSISRRAQWLLFEASACSLGGLFGEGGGQGRSPALGCPIPASALCWGPGGHPVGVTRAVHAPRAPGIPAMSLFRPQPPVATDSKARSLSWLAP